MKLWISALGHVSHEVASPRDITFLQALCLLVIDEVIAFFVLAGSS